MRTLPLLTLLAVTGLVGCGGDDETPTTEADTGTAVVDTGTGTTDTGTGTTDTGTATTDTGTATDAPATDAPADAPSDTPAALVVNGCADADYIDATMSGGMRKLDPWDTTSGKKCVKIKKGQSFTWTPTGGFTVHPLQPKDGTTPTPITATATGASKTIDFNNEGTFGYVCGVHASMTGAIRVVP
jgi:plastocyanin